MLKMKCMSEQSFFCRLRDYFGYNLPCDISKVAAFVFKDFIALCLKL